ncbi:MAG: hypothetical protein V1887_04405 [Candidatus Aenigmatarchaeota archaeon]
MEKKKLLAIVVILVVIGALIAIFYPKARVVGGLRGFVAADATAYREEFDCAGIRYDYCPEQIMDYGCDYLCFGMLYSQKCYVQSAEGKTETSCR